MDVFMLRLRIVRWLFVACLFAPIYAICYALAAFVYEFRDELMDEGHWDWRRMSWMFRHGKHASKRSWAYDWEGREP